MKKFRIPVIIAILAASVVFGLQFFLGSGGVKSRAGAEGVQVFFEKDRINTVPEGVVEVNVFLTSSASAKISAVKANFTYPADLLTYYPTPEGQSESHCYKPKLTKEVSVSDRVDPVNKSLRLLTITRTAMIKDEDLPSGLFCLGTFVFKPKKAGEGKLSFNENLSEWEIVGPQNAFAPSFDKNKNSIVVTVGQVGQMCNASCFADSDCGGAGLVCYKEGWPDTCPPLPTETLGKLKKGQTLPNEDINALGQICPLAKDQLKLKLNGMPTILKGVCRNPQCPTTSINASCQCAIQNKINWKTQSTSLEADDFYILSNGKKFLGDKTSLIVRSDPPNPPNENYTTLEATWKENNQEMRLYIYFYKNDKSWWSNEMRTYNAKVPPDWITYKGKYFESPLGQTWKGETTSFKSEDGFGQIYFLNPRIKAFLKNDSPTPTICYPKRITCAITCGQPRLCTDDGCGEQTCCPATAPCVTPTPSPACQKSQGDADCKNGIDLKDFEIWRKEFTGELDTKTANFNNDNKVSLADFEVWRSSYFKIEKIII